MNQFSPCVIAKMRQIVSSVDLDLHGAIILTEAATGPFAVTPVLAAIAGAERVYAFTRASRFGTIPQVTRETMALAAKVGCTERITIFSENRKDIVGKADIVTNSGHLRPLDKSMIDLLKPTAVIPLMYEAWEFRSDDVNLEACTTRGIPVAGTNEEHPIINVFQYLGVTVVKQLLAYPIEILENSILLLCDNPFAPHIEGLLKKCGAHVIVSTPEDASWHTDSRFDAIVVAMTPRKTSIIGPDNASILKDYCPCGPVIQCWGDIDRKSLDKVNLPYIPSEAPPQGHMGEMPSALGLSPLIKLQVGGLKVGEIMWREMRSGSTAQRAVDASVEAGFGKALT